MATAKIEPLDMKLEVVVLGVSDVDRAKAFSFVVVHNGLQDRVACRHLHHHPEPSQNQHHHGKPKGPRDGEANESETKHERRNDDDPAKAKD